MYKGFIIDDFDENSDFSSVNTKTIFEIVKSTLSNENEYLVNDTFNSCLSDFISQDSIDKDVILDGSKIIDTYFPRVQADIFISHSHKDVEAAKEFAKFIYVQAGLKSFIDSEVWSYADDLLNDIDVDYCLKTNNCYSYEKRNVSTSYVHMMLNTALLNMIDRCECLFFLSTPNSFYTEHEIKNTTFSPWIYSELSMANAIEKRIPYRFRHINKSLLEQAAESYVVDSAATDLKIALKPKIENLISCETAQLKDWLSRCVATERLSNLDMLYKMFDSQKKSTMGKIYG